MAHSLLSDRIWLEKKIIIMIEKDVTEQNNESSFSGMIHAPLIPNQTFSRKYESEKTELLNPTEFPPKTSHSEIQKHDLTSESSISQSSMFFQWGPSIEQTTEFHEADPNRNDQEWANNEFAGFRNQFDQFGWR